MMKLRGKLLMGDRSFGNSAGYLVFHLSLSAGFSLKGATIGNFLEVT